MFEKHARKERVHSDLNIGNVLLEVVVKRKENAHHWTGIKIKHLQNSSTLIWTRIITSKSTASIILY